MYVRLFAISSRYLYLKVTSTRVPVLRNQSAEKGSRDSVLIPENTGQRIPLLQRILRSL